MLLKRIKYKNFRCFRGEMSIELSGIGDKNIIVLLGDNTKGKSTFVQSFVWCFYGIANFSNPEIYNRAIAKELPIQGKTSASVEVEFEHENVSYTVYRSQAFRKNEAGHMMPIYGEDTRFSMTYLDEATGQTKPCGALHSELAKAINFNFTKGFGAIFLFCR